MGEPFLIVWSDFLKEVRAAGDILASEVRTAVDNLVTAGRSLESRFESSATWKVGPGKTEGLRVLYEEHARRLLLDTIESYHRSPVDGRLARAFADYHHRLDDAAQKLPVMAEVSPAELVGAIGDATDRSLWVRLTRLRTGGSTVLLRAAALDAVSAMIFNQRLIEGGGYLVQAQTTLALLDPWQLVHRHGLDQLRGHANGESDRRMERAREKWVGQIRKLQAEGEDILEKLDANLEHLTTALGRRVVGGPRPSAHRRQLARRRQYEAYWSRQRATVRKLVDSEMAFVGLGARSVRIAVEAIGSVSREHQSISEELRLDLERLKGWAPGQPDPFPAASSRLVGTAERTRRWRAEFERSARQLLPDRIDSIEPTRPLPGVFKPWREVAPRQLFLDAIDDAAIRAEDGFVRVERRHRACLREIDRAREVVAYSLQARDTEGDGGDQIASEGVENALGLLTHQAEAIDEPTPVVEPAIVTATASAFYQFLVAFELGRLSLVSHLAREGASRALRNAAVLAAEDSRKAFRMGWSAIRRGYTWALVSIGWIAPPIESRKPVETWSYLGDGIGTIPVQLPLIYARLFRPEPVEDRRFLIGREEEIAALEEARDFWKAGRQASVVVDGERGSGKTSLLNCAVSGPFSGEAVVRVSIRERLMTPDAVNVFLGSALGVAPGDVRSSLERERRIVVLEEAERTFLRRVDGSEAIRALLTLIADTTTSTLWVLSLTSEGYRFLNAALGFRRWFSHRLHASAVSPSELQDAILQRHNLSGLRLEFAPPPRKGRLQEWLRQQTARVQSPEEAFFEDLHDLSGGVFRSAFSIWRRHIDRVDGGVLHLRFLESPDHSRLSQALSREDLFFLQMLLQHGSLTPGEASRIFDCPVHISEARIRHLIARGILEPEPVAPGFRVQPEAGILVRVALNASNLI